MNARSLLSALVLPAVLVTQSTSVSAQTTFSDVHPIFRAYCMPCHVNVGSGGMNIASASITTAYADSQLLSYYTPGQTKGFASLVRIQNGDMPLGTGCTGDPLLDAGNPTCLKAADQARIQDWINDGQLPPVNTTGTPFCYGDGFATACPCGNSGVPGNGCANSVVPIGGRLRANGTPSVSADTLVLVGSQMPNNFALYFQGTLQSGGGSGTVFGDGLRCAAGAVLRLGTKLNAANASQFPQPGDPSISVLGAVPAGGGTRHYQVWYRNGAAFCTSDTFNLTNGLTVNWIS